MVDTNYSLKYRKEIVNAKRVWDKNPNGKVFQFRSSLGQSIIERQKELCIYGGGVAILSKAEGKPILLYSPGVQKHFGIRDDADKYEYLHTPYNVVWTDPRFDNFIDLLYFISRDRTRPEYVSNISEVREPNVFEYPFQFQLRKEYEILHCSAGEVLFFSLLWRLLIELIIKNNDLNCIYSKALFNSGKRDKNWFAIFQQSKHDVIEKILIQKLTQAEDDDKKKKDDDKKKSSVLSKTVLAAKTNFLKSIKCDPSVKYLFEELGVLKDKSIEELNRYTDYLFGDKFIKLTPENTDDYAHEIIVAFAQKASLKTKDITLGNLLSCLHDKARFPVLPYYFLMLFDKQKELKEHIVFPLWYTFSKDTKYPYGKNKSESAVLHALYTVKPIWENEIYNCPTWYTEDFKYETEKIDTGFEKYLNDLYSFFTSMSKPIIDKEYYAEEATKNINIVKRQATKAAISQVMARNMSHNIGSHVLSRMIRWNDILTKERSYQSSLNTKTQIDYQYEIEYFNSYLKTRMDFLADIATSTPTIQNTKQFKSELLKGFDDNRLLLNKISGITDFNFTIKVYKDGVELTDQDFPVSISNDVLGFHAFYIILENIIRNTAKHSFTPEKEVKVTQDAPNAHIPPIEFKIDVTDSDPEIDNSLWEITISDNIAQTSPVPIIDKEDQKKYKSILSKGSSSIKRIDKLVYDQNARLNKSILDDENNLLRQGAWGLIEMDVSAAYLRKIPQENVDDDKYQIPLNNAEMAKFSNDLNKEKFKIIEAVEVNDCLGYKFYLPKPKELLIIDHAGDIWNTMFKGNEKEKEKVLNEWESKGILFLKNSGINIGKWDFKKDFSYPHELVLSLGLDKSIKSSPFISKRQITIDELQWSYIKFYNQNKLPNEQITNVDVLQLSQEQLIIEVWRAWIVKRKSVKAIGKFDDLLIDDYLPSETSENINYTFDFDKHGHDYDGDDIMNYYEIFPSQFKDSVARIKAYPKTSESCPPPLPTDVLIEKFKFFDSALSNVLILDERIQQMTLSERYPLQNNIWYLEGLQYREIWDKVNVYIPLEDEINLNRQNFKSTSFDDIVQFANHRLVQGIRNHTTKNGTLSKDINRVCKGIDFIVIHLGIIEKILKAEGNPNKGSEEIESFIKRLNKEFANATIIITSGRGKPENLPTGIPYLGYSVISQYLIENRFKTLLTQTLYSARPQKK